MKKNLLTLVVIVLSLSFSSLKSFAQIVPGGSADGEGAVVTPTGPIEVTDPTTTTNVALPTTTSSTTFFTAFSSYFTTCHVTGKCSKSGPCNHASCYRANLVDMFAKGHLNCTGIVCLYSCSPKGCK